MNVRGTINDRRVFVNGLEVFPEEGQAYRNHSPDGFNWGYGGSGPAQLAITLTIVASRFLGINKYDALSYYQQIKFKFVSTLPQADFETDLDIDGFIKEKIGVLKSTNRLKRME